MKAYRFKLSDYYSSGITLTCHWCPLSQPYAGVDALLSCLDGGWEITGDVYFDEHWFGEARRILVYRFDLIKQNRCVTMHIVWNPMLDRLLMQLDQIRVTPAGLMNECPTNIPTRLDEQVSAPDILYSPRHAKS